MAGDAGEPGEELSVGNFGVEHRFGVGGAESALLIFLEPDDDFCGWGGAARVPLDDRA